MTQLLLDGLVPELGDVTTLAQGLAFFTQVGMPSRNLAPRTRREYETDLKDVIAFLKKGGITALTQVRLSHLETYQAELDRRELRPSSRNRKTYAIKTFFTFLHTQGAILTNVADRLIPPEVERSEPRILSETEYKALQQVCRHNVRDTAIIELYLQTGMNLSEMVRLKVSDIDIPAHISSDIDDTGTVRVQRRRGRVEAIPLNFKASTALATYLKTRPPVPTDQLFLSRLNQPYSTRAMQYTVSKYLEKIGIANASVRTLRHTMATHHIAKGTPLLTLQETLGHASPDTTAVYIPLAKKMQRKALQEHAL